MKRVYIRTEKGYGQWMLLKIQSPLKCSLTKEEPDRNDPKVIVIESLKGEFEATSDPLSGGLLLIATALDADS